MSPRPLRTAWFFAAAVLACVPAFAQVEEEPRLPDSDWETLVTASSTAPVSSVGATTPEGGFSAPERFQFVEEMRRHVLDQLCRSINLDATYGAPGDFSGSGGRVRRYLAPMPDGRLTIVDEERLSVGYGHGFSKAFTEAAGAAVGVSVGARIEGGSMVIRPLEGKATCKELDRLIDVRDVKTVLPLKASRIAAMRTGELWRLPFSVTFSHSESVSVPVTPEAGASVSFGASEAGAATLTLFRLSDSQLRFRFRIDRVKVQSRGGGVSVSIPAVRYAAEAAKLGTMLLENEDVQKAIGGRKYPAMGAKSAADALDHEIARQINAYAAASLGLSSARVQGKRVVLEYVVDPRDPAHAEAVAKALHGDFGALAKMAWRLGTQQATDESTEAAYLRMKAEHDAKLGAAAYAAIDSYRRRSRSASLNLPLLTLQNWSKNKGDDTMKTYTGEGGEYHFEQADRSRSSEYVNLPYLGPVIKDNVQRDVQVVTHAEEGKPFGDPIVVYLQQHGFLRETESSVRRKAERLNEIIALAGTRGGGPNPRTALPLAEYFPASPSPGLEGPSRKGSMSFTLVFNQQAIKELAAASSDDILKSYAAVCGAKPAMEWLFNNGVFTKEGDLVYDKEAAREFEESEENAGSASIAKLAKVAAGLVSDLLAVRDAPDNEARSTALAKAFGGLGRSGLKYDEAVRVFVQLVDPLNLTGDFTASVDRPLKKQPDVNLHLVLKKDRPESLLLKDAGAAKSRFAEPSILVD